MTYDTAPASFQSLSRPQQPSIEIPSRRALEVYYALGFAVDASRNTSLLSWRGTSGMETITTGHFY